MERILSFIKIAVFIAKQNNLCYTRNRNFFTIRMRDAMEENKTKIKVTEENLKELEAALPKEEQWQNLDISNDFMFAKVMRNPEFCKGILERLLEIRIARIEYPETQKVVTFPKMQKVYIWMFM